MQIDDISLLVTCPAALSVRKLEGDLNEEGYTLGYFIPKNAKLTVGQLLEKNPSNLFYRTYGQPIDFCVGLTFQEKKGEVYHSKKMPRSATGPDFRRLLLESRRRLGTINEAVLRIHPLPEEVDWHRSYWPTELDGEEFIRELSWIHIHPEFAGIYPVAQQPRSLQYERKILLVLRFAGPEGMVRCYLQRAGQIAKKMKGEVLRVSKKKVAPLLEQLMSQERP